MKRTITFLALAMLLLIVYSCNNGNYDADPNTDNSNTSSSLTCDLQPADSVCSCTDSLSWYSNGELFVSRIGIAIKPYDTLLALQDTASQSAHGGIFIQLTGYHGVGTYTNVDHDMQIDWYVPEDDIMYRLDGDCAYFKLVITHDDGENIKGTFFGVSGREVDYDVFQYRAIKGGQFASRITN